MPSPDDRGRAAWTVAFWVAVVWGAANAISSLLIIAGVGVAVVVVAIVLARLLAWLVRELRRRPPPPR